MCNRSFWLLIPFLTTGCVTHWEGGFHTAEYRLHVQDAGRPVTGAVLVVRDRKGYVSYDQPIDDFNRSIVLRSDENGELVFHHLSHGGFEFGWTCYAGVHCSSGQAYDLDIEVDGRRRARVPFDSLDQTPNWNQLPVVDAGVTVALARAWMLFPAFSARADELRDRHALAMQTQRDWMLLEVYSGTRKMRRVDRAITLDP